MSLSHVRNPSPHPKLDGHGPVYLADSSGTVLISNPLDRRGTAIRKFRFKAKIERGTGGGAFILFPFDTAREFGIKGRIPVKSTIDNVPYAGSLIKYGHPQHMLGILKSIREQIGKKPGDIVDVVLWKDEELRTVDVPSELRRRMEDEGLVPFFEKLSYTHQKEYCRWITEAKREETRLQRIEKAIKMLSAGIKTPE